MERKPLTVGRRLRRGAWWTAAVRLALLVLTLAANILLARLLTPADLGAYSLLFSAGAVVWTVGQLGLQGAVVKLMSEALAAGAPGRASSIARRALLLTAVASTLLAPVFAGIALAVMDRASVPAVAICIVALALPPIALYVVAAEAFRGLHDYAAASLQGPALYVALLTGLFGALYLAEGRVPLAAAAGACLTAASIASGVAILSLMRRLRALGPLTHVDNRELLPVALPLMAGYLAMLVASQADLWVLGAYRPAEEVAAYAAAIRLVQHVCAPLLIMGAVIAPVIAELRLAGDRTALERVVQRAALVDLVPALVAFVALLVAAGDILALLFGEHYRLGATAALLLGAGLLGQALMGPALIVLAMSTGQRAVMAVCMVAGMVQVTGGLLVVGHLGMAGVAAVSAASTTLQALLAMLLVRWQSGMWTTPFVGVPRVLFGLRRRALPGQRSATVRQEKPR